MAAKKSHSTTTKPEEAETIKCCLVRWLLGGGLGFQKASHAIGNEVLFSRNWRRADLLLLADQFHAIEIKSDADSLSRLREQLEDYHKTFDKVSVATTLKWLLQVQRSIDSKTGIILIAGGQPKVIRKARLSKRLDKVELARFLDRATLVRHLARRPQRMSTDELRHQVAYRLSIDALRAIAYANLRQRYGKLFRLFLSDVGDRHFGEDELRSLCGSIHAITL